MSRGSQTRSEVSLQSSAQGERGRTKRKPTLRARAFSNFFKSDWPLSDEPAARKTYLTFPLMFSFQVASHVTLLSCTTSFHLWPLGGCGTGASLPMLIVICSGRTRVCEIGAIYKDQWE